MKPFFSYFGTKYSHALRLGKPTYSIVVEPFAGSAGYSCFWEPQRAILVDKNANVAQTWDYILHVKESEFLSLPILDAGDDLRDLDLPVEARIFLGFNIGQANDHPLNIRPREGWSMWDADLRAKLASQLPKVRGWRFLHADYRKAPYLPATYLLDPPYQRLTNCYGGTGFKSLNFFRLAIFAMTLPGEVIVCENANADWLPFQSFANRKSSLFVRAEFSEDHEVICRINNPCCFSCYFRFGSTCWLHSRQISEFEACSFFSPQTEGFPLKCGSCVHYLPPLAPGDVRTCRQGIKALEETPSCCDYKAKDGYRLTHWLSEESCLCESDPNPLATDGTAHPVTCQQCMHLFLDLTLDQKIAVLERHGLDDKIKALRAAGVRASVTPQRSEVRHAK